MAKIFVYGTLKTGECNHWIAKEFLKLVVYAYVIALPLAFLYMKTWLNDFAYQTEIGWTIFFISGLVALFISILTVSYQSVKVAITNPVDSVRYE